MFVAWGSAWEIGGEWESEKRKRATDSTVTGVDLALTELFTCSFCSLLFRLFIFAAFLAPHHGEGVAALTMVGEPRGEPK